MEKVAYSVPFCLRILNCSGDRIARHSSSGLLTDPGAEEAIATIRARWKLRENDQGDEAEERLRRLRCNGEEEANRVVLTKALMVEAKVKDVAEDTRPVDDVMTFNAIVVDFLSSFFLL